MNTTNNTLTIGRNKFSVSSQLSPRGELRYTLRGKRGAIYVTYRRPTQPHLMFLCHESDLSVPAGYEGVWLTDKDGDLRVAA